MTVEVFKGEGKHPWYFRFVSGNEQIVGGGEGYTRAAGAKRGAEGLISGILAMFGLRTRKAPRWIRQAKDLYALD